MNNRVATKITLERIFIVVLGQIPFNKYKNFNVISYDLLSNFKHVFLQIILSGSITQLVNFHLIYFKYHYMSNSIFNRCDAKKTKYYYFLFIFLNIFHRKLTILQQNILLFKSVHAIEVSKQLTKESRRLQKFDGLSLQECNDKLHVRLFQKKCLYLFFKKFDK